MTNLRLVSLRALGAIAILATLCATSAHASKPETTLFTFPGGTSTTNPFTLIADGNGNYFGTAVGGNGSVFELSPASGGGWTVTTLYEFPGATGPYYPEGIVMDSSGNIFVACTSGPGEGSIAELSPNGAGGYTEKTIFEFNGTNGREPLGVLVLDSAGNIYGTTNTGGQCAAESVGCGLAYQLTQQAGGKWKENILYRFGASTDDGQFPISGLAFDSKGNLYGTTAGGGLTGCPNANEYCGTVFELAHTAKGWKEKVLYRLTIFQGEYPWGVPVLDGDGNLYATAYEGGPAYYGTVFALNPTSEGEWTFHMIHSFKSFTTGSTVVGGVTIDPTGSLLVATQDGGVERLPCLESDGTAAGCGSVWRFTPAGDGQWEADMLYLFQGGSDGMYLDDLKLVLDPSGNIFGVAAHGGDSNSDGTIFEITP
jgi:hypothetical protein